MKDLAYRSTKDHSNAVKQAQENPESFWSKIAEGFHWYKKWDTTLEYDFNQPSVKWFLGGQLNITENCLDRHVVTQPDKTALIFEPNNPSEAAHHISYKVLHQRVCRAANMLKSNGAKKGDRVCIYMPMVPELTIAVLACARIGAIHSVVFAGFSATALAARINDAQCSLLLTADGGFRGSKVTPLKEIADDALLNCPSIKNTIVLKRTGQEVSWNTKDLWWHEEIEKASDVCLAEVMDSEDPLFILYTSGSTGKPKGMVHTCGGYMVYTAYSFQNVFQYQKGDVYWCTADIGWITGHSYIVYGPLTVGATTLMFEGVPSYPDYGRFWEVCAKHKVNQFYTAPTAIRALQKHPTELVTKHDLSSLKVLGSVGEPINEEAWHWYDAHVGKHKCPIVDTWWQTETGAHMLTPLPGATDTKPGSATQPFFGIEPALLDPEGVEIKGAGEGLLMIKSSWPSQIRSVYGDHQRCIDTYFSAYPGYYFTGDGARRDEDGYYWITGRVDDVLNVSGHRMGTAEVESALVLHQSIAEAAVVGYPHDIKGQGIYCYVTPMANVEMTEALRAELVAICVKEIGPIAKPDLIQWAPGLPKTRSGKIMRRILRKIAANELDNLGDTSTLADPAVVEDLIENRHNR